MLDFARSCKSFDQNWDPILHNSIKVEELLQWNTVFARLNLTGDLDPCFFFIVSKFGACAFPTTLSAVKPTWTNQSFCISKTRQDRRYLPTTKDRVANLSHASIAWISYFLWLQVMAQTLAIIWLWVKTNEREHSWVSIVTFFSGMCWGQNWF